jgi:radical SAM superfamily enzyme YgiQ (UPF0313 family)
MRISSLLREHGHDTRLAVATEEDPLQVALEWQPDVFGYSVYTGTQKAYLELNDRLRAVLPGALSVFGGPHPTFFEELIEQDGVDGVCIGEGERATLELMDALQSGRDHSRIRNWHWKTDSGEIVRNPVRPLLSDVELDALPFSDRELLYRAHQASRRHLIRPFITGRGCPYNCSFCFNNAYSEIYQGRGARTRRRSVDNVLAEIAEVRDRHGLSFVMFYDDTFILNRKWLSEFAEKYPLVVGLPWWAQARPELVTDDRVALLKRAGCHSISFGLETGNDELRTVILNRKMSKQQIIDAGRVLRRHGIAFSTNNMVGIPRGGLEADLETLHLNVACRPDYANCFIYQPYPKTVLGELAREEGLIDSFDDLSGSVTDDTPLRFPPAERRQIENLQKLFSATVEFPWLLPLVKRAIRLPRNRLFWLVYKLWKGYALKQRIFSYRMSGREMLANLWSYMRISTQ